MKFILKILQGANAGAEVALAEGNVTFGTSDRCDIVLADSALAEEAFALETTTDGVSLRLLPDGEAKHLEPYRPVTEGGTTFAIGVEGEPWREPPPPAPASAPDPAPAPEVTPAPPPPAPSSPREEPPRPRRRFAGCLTVLLVLLLFLLFFVGGYFLALRYGSFWRAYFEKGVGGDTVTPSETDEKTDPETLESWAAKHGFTVQEKDGVRIVSGNFAKRGDKLEAMRDAYAIDPALVLDFSDDETLREGMEALLFVATEGRVKLLAATNRVVAIGGKAATKEELLRTVASICSDVNHVRIVDDTAVVCGDGRTSTKPTEYRAVKSGASTPFDTVARKGMPTPKNPVAGIITKPYPCLVLRDGSRAAEGAMVGGFQIEKIEPDRVILRKGEERTVWKP